MFKLVFLLIFFRFGEIENVFLVLLFGGVIIIDDEVLSDLFGGVYDILRCCEVCDFVDDNLFFLFL